MFINKTTNTSHNFVAPEGDANAIIEVLFPTFKKDTVAYAAAIAAAIGNMKTMLVVGELTGDLALTAVINAAVTAGAELVVVLPSDATVRTVTLGAGFAVGTIETVANQTTVASFLYDGTSFIHVNDKTGVRVATFEEQTKADGATIAVTIAKDKTLVVVDEMAADATLNATLDADLENGAEVVVILSSDGTARAVTLGTGFDQTITTIAGTISKTKAARFMFNGTSLVLVGLSQLN
jgi:hypothetical protein